MSETRYLVPSGADWAVWDDVNGVLTFMTDAEAVENARENEALLGAEFRELPDNPTPDCFPSVATPRRAIRVGVEWPMSIDANSNRFHVPLLRRRDRPIGGVCR